ncbi:hypothetical protein DLM46_06235 [Paraburkholderia lacunae]|uniref:Uncharacterized protein n=1 Tax=Paraburkholderia lacunae TaxID=2211104 RepID=A0A370NDX1_9BURK|nr:hypothetical protein DLM46_06235 [Paraburkholderia lacunae]
MVGILARLESSARLHQLSGYSQLQNLPALWHGVKHAKVDCFTECGCSVDTPLDKTLAPGSLPGFVYAFKVAGCRATKGTT